MPDEAQGFAGHVEALQETVEQSSKGGDGLLRASLMGLQENIDGRIEAGNSRIDVQG